MLILRMYCLLMCDSRRVSLSASYARFILTNITYTSTSLSLPRVLFFLRVVVFQVLFFCLGMLLTWIQVDCVSMLCGSSKVVTIDQVHSRPMVQTKYHSAIKSNIHQNELPIKSKPLNIVFLAARNDERKDFLFLLMFFHALGSSPNASARTALAFSFVILTSTKACEGWR